MTDDIVTRLRELAIGAIYGINIAPFEHYNAAADEIERLREILGVMSDHVLAVCEEIRQFRTITHNYMRNHNEVAGEKVKGYVNSEIIPEELWLLALTYRTEHVGSYDDYAERRQNL